MFLALNAMNSVMQGGSGRTYSLFALVSFTFVNLIVVKSIRKSYFQRYEIGQARFNENAWTILAITNFVYC